MKQRANRRRGVIFLLSAVMVFSAFAVAHAEEGGGAASHVHTNKCNNENGDLICGFAQTENGKAGKSEKRSAAVEADRNIYPGGEEALPDGKKVWVAYDAKYIDAATQPQDATVKATVKLPDGIKAPENYKLFIDKIEDGEKFYPSEAAVKAKVSAYNGYQCYMIRWIEVNDGGTIASDPNTKSMADILGDDNSTAQPPKNVTIKIDYLTDGAKLAGPAGARKLLIFNSTGDGALQDTVSDSVTDVDASETHYRSFTFKTHQAGPYVFVSKHLEKGYVSGLKVSEVLDGFDPFDHNDSPGYDSGNNNGIVRSYDTIQYTLAATFGARQNEVTAERINVFFELSLKKSATAARFDTTKMNWLEDNYSIEYLNGKGDVVMIQTHTGEFRLPQRDDNGNVVRNEHGFAQAGDQTVSFNARLNGSKNGKDSYKVTGSSIVEQRLTGWTTAVAKKGENILNATRTYKAAVEVRNADNEEVFQPTFRMWLEGNEDNYGSEGNEGSSMQPAQPWEGNVASPAPISVSAGTNFNLQLKKNTDMSYKNWFDFSTGDVVAADVQKELDALAKLEANHGKSNPAEFVDENGNGLDEKTKAKYENYRYGRITCYGITLQLYNDTDVEPIEDKRASKGLKGLSLPVGNIEFDLSFSSVVKSGNNDFDGSKSEYTPILWDYNENLPADHKYTFKYADPGRESVTFEATGLGNGGRRLYWDGEERSSYAKGAAPGNYKDYHNGCYYGGDWALMNGEQKLDSREKLSQVAHPTKVSGTGGDTTYHFSVSDYDFDFDTHLFPLKDAGNSGNVTGYDTYARCFSAGCVQVLSVFPRVQKESTANISLNATVSNLRLETRAGQKLQAKQEDSTKIEHEVNKKDNIRNDEIVVYAPGKLTKGSAFNGKYRNNPPTNTGEGFLGTEYWTTSYDCSTFAGDDIWIMSYGMMSSGSDYHMKSMNLLQIFDSRALSIRGNPDVIQNAAEGDTKGNVKFLYAADPDYPDGYDTNSGDGRQVVKYMNTVREEDLVYSENIDTANGTITVDGKTLKCIGVLMEIRGCDLLGGKYQYMRIPVKVNGDDETLIGKTVATVNSFRTWSYDIGEEITWSNGKWNGKSGQEGKNVLQGYPAPGHENNLERYSGELANGGKLTYTKTEYKDGLKVEGTHGGGTLAGNSLLILGYKAHVNLTVDHKSSESGSHIYNQDSDETIVDYRLKNIKTEISDLTHQENAPRTKLEVRAILDKGNDTGKDRISIAGGSYKMEGQTISSDSNAPTEVTFTAGEDGKLYTVSVYASLSGSGRDVTFFISNAPVGIQLPDITFQANFASIKNLTDNAAITADAYISGTGDTRAYSKADGNTDNVTVNVVLGGGTNLSKDVTEKYIELDGVIHYEITYTNSGSSDIHKVYFYDLLPNTRDIRESNFDGEIVLRDFDVESSGTKDEAADATVYYSTVEYPKLYDEIKKFGGTMAPDGTVTGDEQGVEDMLKEPKWFKELMTVQDGVKTTASSLPTDKAELEKLLEEITGLYIRTTGLKKNQTITLRFTIQTKGNKAGDLYRNISNSWIPNNGTLPLKSTRVETAVISRSISGVVWYDHNLNGIRDVEAQNSGAKGAVQGSGMAGGDESGGDESGQAYDEEKLLQGVTATLFKKSDTTGKYEQCTEDVTGAEIKPMETGADGAYSFGNLAQGDYIVAFSGKALEQYTAATFYQSNGKNDSNTSDGKKTAEVSGAGSDVDGIDSDTYPYCIRYSADAPNMKLHSIDEIKAGETALNNYREEYNHQDLGVVVAGYELPETGGRGTVPYTVGGILLILASLLTWCFIRRYRTYM